VGRIRAEQDGSRAHRAHGAGKTTMFNVITGLQEGPHRARRPRRVDVTPQERATGRRAAWAAPSSVSKSSGLSACETTSCALEARRTH